MDKKEIEEISEFVESWRDHFYHEHDGCEGDADDMLKDWEELKLRLTGDKRNG